MDGDAGRAVPRVIFVYHAGARLDSGRIVSARASKGWRCGRPVSRMMFVYHAGARLDSGRIVSARASDCWMPMRAAGTAVVGSSTTLARAWTRVGSFQPAHPMDGDASGRYDLRLPCWRAPGLGKDRFSPRIRWMAMRAAGTSSSTMLARAWTREGSFQPAHPMDGDAAAGTGGDLRLPRWRAPGLGKDRFSLRIRWMAMRAAGTGGDLRLPRWRAPGLGKDRFSPRIRWMAMRAAGTGGDLRLPRWRAPGLGKDRFSPRIRWMAMRAAGTGGDLRLPRWRAPGPGKDRFSLRIRWMAMRAAGTIFVYHAAAEQDFLRVEREGATCEHQKHVSHYLSGLNCHQLALRLRFLCVIQVTGVQQA